MPRSPTSQNQRHNGAPPHWPERLPRERFSPLFEACHGRVSRIGFDQAWQIVEYLMEQVDDLPRPWEDGILYSLAHTVLSVAEKGATPAQLREGLAAYCRALPADVAGLIVLETICDALSPIEGD